MPQSIGFHAFFRMAPHREEVIRAADAAASALGFDPTQPREQGWPTLEYSGKGGPPIAVVFSEQGEWQQLLVCGVSGESIAIYGTEKLGSLFCGLAHDLKVTFGRTFAEDWHGAVAERELGGDIDYLDWFQFLGPSLASRWGVEHLCSGPFHRAEVFEDGSCGLWLTEQPGNDDQREATREAARFLGIALRADFTRGTGGEQAKVNWP